MSNRPLIVKTLKNGLRIAVVSDTHASTVTASVLVGVGSAFETPKENGLSHFLEHVTFKGTVRRPSSKILLEEVESLGAITNAFTSHEFTGYWIKGNPEHVDSFVDILADIYQHSTLPPAELEKEKGVVIEEINMYEDMIPYKVVDVLFELLYGNHAMAKPVLGTKQTVASFSRKDIAAYRSRHYTASNTVIVVSGNVTSSRAISLVKKHFSKLSRSKKSIRASVTTFQKKPMVRLLTKTADQAHLAIAFRSVPFGHKDSAAIRVLSTILGRGMSSRLPLLLRDELGAAYYVSAAQETFVDHGIFLISAGIDKTRSAEVISRIIEECARCKREAVEAKELAKAKEYAIGSVRLGLELSDDVASFYGIQLVLRQKVKTPEEVIAAIERVSIKDIMRVANTLFVKGGANLALVGPFPASALPQAPFLSL